MISSATVSRVHRNPARLSWSGVASRTSAMTSCCCGSERAAACSPGRRPRRRSEKPVPAALPVALDPAVDGVVVDPEHPGGLGLGHAPQTARTARLRSAACAAAGKDRVSSSLIPGAYDTITPLLAGMIAELGGRSADGQARLRGGGLNMDRWAKKPLRCCTSVKLSWVRDPVARRRRRSSDASDSR